MTARPLLLLSALLWACGSSTPAPAPADQAPAAAGVPPTCLALADRTCALCGPEAGLCQRYRRDETDEDRCRQLHVRVGEAEAQIGDQRVEARSREAYREAFCR